MGTRFSALTIRQGDAFLLENDEWKCLFDSGWDQTVVELLAFKGIDDLDLAICSHNDADHARGFIKWFERGFRINEIWLPGIWANVLRFVKEYWNADEHIDWVFENDIENYDGSASSLLSNDSVTDESFNHDLDFLKEFGDNEFIIRRYCRRLHRNLFDNHTVLRAFLDRKWLQQSLDNHSDYDLDDDYMDHSLLRAMSFDDQFEKIRYLRSAFDIKLTNILLIASSAIRHNCKIRWFEPTSACTKVEIDYGFISLNASKMCSIRMPKSSLAYLYLLKLTEENKHSLVFEFKNDDVPIIRFLADFDCACQRVYLCYN